jgi:hypothetical protein
MSLINLLPHPVTIIDGDRLRRIDPSGTTARLREHEDESAPVDGIPVSIVMTGDVVGIPQRSPGTHYIVNKVTIMASPMRNDLLCPMGIVRDDNGNVIGCTHLGRYA